MKDERLKRLQLLAGQALIHHRSRLVVERCGNGFNLTDYKWEKTTKFYTYSDLSRRLRDIILRGER